MHVKSRYQSDCGRSFPVKERSIDAFDYLIVAFLNIGKFYGGNDGSTGEREPEFYTLAQDFIREHHNNTTTWEKVRLTGLQEELECSKNGKGFEQIAKDLGIPRPSR